MPIPKSRTELLDYVRSTFHKLKLELDAAGPQASDLHCVDDWRFRDLMAVRAWWTQSVVDWIEAGKRGEYPVTPAPGYRWRETPRLNTEIVTNCQDESYVSICERLYKGYDHVISTIDSLDDHELLDVGVFNWAGNYPLSRWISINTARQYTTARTYLRRALRESR